jgi:hypothetical protein
VLPRDPKHNLFMRFLWIRNCVEVHDGMRVHKTLSLKDGADCYGPGLRHNINVNVVIKSVSF